MSKFQVGEKVSFGIGDSAEALGSISSVSTSRLWANNGVLDDHKYRIKWDDGWVDDPEVYYYDSELKKAD